MELPLSDFTLFGSSIDTFHIDITVPDSMLIALAVYLIAYLFFYHKYSRHKKRQLCYIYLYAGALIALTAMPLYLPHSIATTLQQLPYEVSCIQYQPFASIRSMWFNANYSGQYRLMLYNLLGNLLLLAPLAYLYPNYKGRVSALKMLWVATRFALCIELYQLIGNVFGFCSRDVNIDDIILNIIGCMVAFGICKLCKWIK